MRERTTVMVLAAACLLAGCVDDPEEKLQREDTVELSVDGLTRYNLISSEGGNQARTFTLESNYPWSLVCESDWLGVGPTSGEAGKEYTVVISAEINPARSMREASITLNIDKDGWTKEYTIAQRGPEGQDSHEDGYSFMDEDFSWIPALWTGTLKYGMPVVTSGEETNSPSVSFLSGAAASMSEIWSVYDASSVFARYEGYIMAGDGVNGWSMTTKAFGGIDNDAEATVDLSFDAAVYCDVEGVKDAGVFSVAVASGGGTVLSAGSAATVSGDKKTVSFDLSSGDSYGWQTCHIIIDGVTNDTQLAFSSAGSAGRLLLDNISVVRCSENATASDPAKADRSSEYDFSMSVDGSVDGVENSYGLRIRSEQAWSISSDSDWITIQSVADVNGNTVMSEISADALSASAPSSGVDYCGSLLALSTNTGDARTGSITLTINGQKVKTIQITQLKAVAASGEIAKWTFTGLFCKKFLNVEADPSSPGYDIAYSWINNHYADSDVVTGGRLSAYTKNSKATFTYAATNRACNMLRLGGCSKDDYYLFTVPLVMVEAGSTISFRNAHIATTSAANSPAEWVEEYSLDGENWTTLKEFHLTGGHYAIGKEEEFRSMDCDISVAETIVRGTLYLRMRIASNKTATSTFTDGGADICYIYSDPYIAITSETTKTATYTEDRDYLVFSVSK